MLKPENIEVIELSLINKCNLKCPLCLRQNNNFKLKPEHIDIKYLINFLNTLTNLNRVVFMGSVSEPTLYPHLFELVEYLKNRNIKIRISTNGMTKIDWKKLGESLNSDDIIRFPIDGSTQELHSKYRVGSNINDVLSNHIKFKSNSQAVTILQNIIFQYNEHDKNNMIDLYNKSEFDLIEFAPCYEPNNLESKSDIMPTSKLLRYQKIKNANSIKIVKECPEAKIFSIYINHLGYVLPCNEQEDYYLEHGSKISIYNNTVYECFDFLNNIVKNISCNDICKRSCTKMGQDECYIFPIHQIDRKNNIENLIDFRECMKKR